jgi:hypothetical protein
MALATPSFVPHPASILDPLLSLPNHLVSLNSKKTCLLIYQLVYQLGSSSLFG